MTIKQHLKKLINVVTCLKRVVVHHMVFFKGLSLHDMELPAQRWSGHFYSESKYHPAKHKMLKHK